MVIGAGCYATLSVIGCQLQEALGNNLPLWEYSKVAKIVTRNLLTDNRRPTTIKKHETHASLNVGA